MSPESCALLALLALLALVDNPFAFSHTPANKNYYRTY